jgi:hypothetical protein
MSNMNKEDRDYGPCDIRTALHGGPHYVRRMVFCREDGPASFLGHGTPGYNTDVHSDIWLSSRAYYKRLYTLMRVRTQ